MNDAVLHHDLALIAGSVGWFAAGGVLGLAHFLSLRWTVQGVVARRPLRSFGLQLVRLGLTGTAMILTVRLFGAGPLLAGLLGLMAARTSVLVPEVS